MKGRKPKSTAAVLSAAFLILSLAWLTVSLPFVNAAQQENHYQLQGNPGSCENPLTDTNEEKSETSKGSLSDYLHELLHVERFFVLLSCRFNYLQIPAYEAPPSELLSPPPEA